MNYYQHHIGDFIRDTSRLTDSQCMAYLRLLWMYYESEQPLECDIDAIAFRIGANANDVQQIIKHFFFDHDGLWHHARCDKEILAFRNKSEKAKNSANARWNNANAMRTHSKRKANERVLDANQEPVTNISTNVDIKDKRAPRFDAQAHLVSIGIDPVIASDWVSHRKTLKATPSLTAIDGIATEADRAGISLSAALAMCCQRGWRGFKAGWIADDNQRNGKTQHQLNQEATTRAIFGNPSEFAFTEKLISGEVIS